MSHRFIIGTNSCGTEQMNRALYLTCLLSLAPTFSFTKDVVVTCKSNTAGTFEFGADWAIYRPVETANDTPPVREYTCRPTAFVGEVCWEDGTIPDPPWYSVLKRINENQVAVAIGYTRSEKGKIVIYNVECTE
jgi:hypothetical protein